MGHRVERLWPGSTVAILATGPSLCSEDVAYIRGRVPVIAINDAWRMAPFAEVLYSSDRRWFPHYHGVPEFSGLKYGIGSAPGKANPFHAYSDIRVLKNTGYDGLDLDPTGLRNGKNSGYAAIGLAVHFGAARILLLGYNMGKASGKLHFFGDHPVGLSQNEGLYPSWRRVFYTLIEPLRELGVSVINCTPDTSLDAFPTAALRDVLPAREVAA